MNVISGLGTSALARPARPCTRVSPATWLSGVRPKPTQGVDAFAGVTADQIAAQKIGQDTLLPSLELATEDHSGLIGSCDRGYSCTYMNTISWRTPTTPMPMEINPRKVFERMFGEGGTPATSARAASGRPAASSTRSCSEADGLQNDAGRATTAATLAEYLDTVREIERRIERAGRSRRDRVPASCRMTPAGIPYSFDEHMKLMFDLLALAYQADITRVSTFMMAREVSNRTYPQIGMSGRPSRDVAPSEQRGEAREAGQDPDLPRRRCSRTSWRSCRPRRTATARCSITRVMLYGSNMSNSNAAQSLPAADPRGRRSAPASMKGGRHLKYPDHTPMANLLLTMLDKAGVPQDTLGDSTGRAGAL